MASPANPTDRSRPARGVLLSLAAHGGALLLLLIGLPHPAQVHVFESRGGKRAQVLYWAAATTSGLAADASSKPISPSPSPHRLVTGHAERAAKPHTAEPLPKDELIAAAKSVAGSETPAPDLGGTGSGSEDATPAFPVYSPRPQIADRSLLPASDQNVVVDVRIGVEGQVMTETLVHGVGNRLDQWILDTVRSWRFKPATVNGTAVASVSELVFPLNQKTWSQ